MTVPVDVLIRNGTKTFNLKNEKDLTLSCSYSEHGDDTAEIGYCNWGGRLPDLSSAVSLRDPTYGFFWSGYAGHPRIGGFFGKPTQIQAKGYQYTLQDDGWDETKKFSAGTPLVNLVWEALGKTPFVSNGIPFPDALTLTQLPDESPDFALQSPEDIFEYVKNMFTFLNTPLIWHVRQNPAIPFGEDPCLEMRFTESTPVYSVRLTKNDTFQPEYDSDVIYNKSAIGYGEGLYATAQAFDPYKVITRFRKKRVNANNDVDGTIDAFKLAEWLVERNNVLRPVSTNLELHCDTKVSAIYPAVPTKTSNVPHHFIRNHNVIRILNDMTLWGKYNISEFYIIDAKTDFNTGITSFTLGDPIYYDALRLLMSYMVNRMIGAIDSGVVNAPLRDADAIPTYGPTGSGETPSIIGAGIPIHYLDKAGLLNIPNSPTKPYLPHGAAVHPKDLADYGVQGNYGREVTVGTKGFIRVIPCKLLDWTLDFVPASGSDTMPTGTISVQLYGTWPFTPGVAILDTIQILTGSSNSGTFASPHIFNQGGKVGIRVSVAGTGANMSGAMFQIGLGGQKLYPDLGVSS